MRIQFWKPLPESQAQTWLVNVEDHWFEMSEDANAPNGVNLYAGDDIERSWISGHMEMVGVHLVPNGILRSTLLRIVNFW